MLPSEVTAVATRDAGRVIASAVALKPVRVHLRVSASAAASRRIMHLLADLDRVVSAANARALAIASRSLANDSANQRPHRPERGGIAGQ